MRIVRLFIAAIKGLWAIILSIWSHTQPFVMPLIIAFWESILALGKVIWDKIWEIVSNW